MNYAAEASSHAMFEAGRVHRALAGGRRAGRLFDVHHLTIVISIVLILKIPDQNITNDFTHTVLKNDIFIFGEASKFWFPTI